MEAPKDRMQANRKPTRYGRDPEISARNQDRIRNLIEVEKIVKKLNGHILGRTKMTNTMVRAAEILLRKIQPDLTAIQLSHDEGVGVPLLKIVRAAQAEAIEHEPEREQHAVLPGPSGGKSGAEMQQTGADRQIEHASASSSKVMPD